MVNCAFYYISLLYKDCEYYIHILVIIFLMFLTIKCNEMLHLILLYHLYYEVDMI